MGGMHPISGKSVVETLRRRRRWLIAVAVLLVLRAGLPLAVRTVIVWQASSLLHARVEIGDVDLTLYRAGAVLKDVAVYPADAVAEAPPVIAWKSVGVAVRWLPLFRKTIQLREVVLDSPRVALDRMKAGDLSLMRLLRKGGDQPAPIPAPPPAATGPGWAFGIDRIVVRTGSLRFQDLMLADNEPVEVVLPTLTVTAIAMRPGMYGEPSRTHVEVGIDNGFLQVDSEVTVRDDGLGVDSSIKLSHLPLRRWRVYIPRVGWSELRGDLSANLRHRIDTTGAPHDVRGTVSLRDVTVRVPGIEDPALAWKRLIVEVESLDLAEQRAAVAKVDLDGLLVLARTQDPEPLPLLRPAVAAAVQAPAPEPSSAGGPAARPWHWSVAAVQLSDATVRVASDVGQLNVGVAGVVKDLADEGEQPGAVKMQLKVGDGSLGVDGQLRLAPIGFAGRMTADNLNVPDAVTAFAAAPPVLVKSARLSSDLVVAAGSSAPTLGDINVRGTISLVDTQLAAPSPAGATVGVKAIQVTLEEAVLPGLLALKEAGDPVAPVPGDIRVRGKLGLIEPKAQAADPKDFAAGAASIDIGLDEVLVPNPRRPAGPPAVLRVRLGDVRVAAPSVRITRTKEGIVLPQFAGAASPAAAPASPPPTPAVTPSAGSPVDLFMASLQMTKGRIAFSDRSLQPFYAGVIAPIEISVNELRFPVLSAKRLQLDASVAPQGTIKVRGRTDLGAATASLKLDEVALPPFNPYAAAYSSYGIRSGRLSLDARVSFASNGYEAANAITLHDLDVAGAEGDSLFQQHFGISLTLALALLKDLSGNIALNVPIESDAEGLTVGTGTIIAGALRRALLGALASPLKLFGAFMPGGTTPGGTPPGIVFRSGRADSTAEGEEQINQIAAFVASRPGMHVTIEAVPSTRDARWLREQALARELGEPQGIFGAARNIGSGGVRDRIAKALSARARDEPGELDEEDRGTLEHWLDERPPPAAGELRALAEARLARIERVLRDEHGVDASRVARAEIAAEPTDDAPLVRLQIGAVKKGE